MRKNLILKTCALVLALLMALGCFAACGEDNVSDEGGVVKLSFSEANSIDDMKKLDGKTVSIIGYMSTLSPVNGEFMYLMNMPYQSCPFCIPNTTQLSNTLAVYAKNGKSFEFTDLLIRVEGVLEFGDYTDEQVLEHARELLKSPTDWLRAMAEVTLEYYYKIDELRATLFEKKWKKFF